MELPFSGRQMWQGLCPAIHEWIRQDQNKILNLLVVRAETLFLLQCDTSISYQILGN